MSRRVQVREVSEEERAQLERVSRSRTAPQRHVERARIILGLLAGKRVEEVAAQVGRSGATVYNQLHQFNERGMAFLDDLPRAGRGQTYDGRQRGEMIATARTHPQRLGLPFGHWTLDRLVAYVNQELGIPILGGCPVERKREGCRISLANKNVYNNAQCQAGDETSVWPALMLIR